MKYIIDTNVPLKAANMCPVDILDARCSLACLNFIKKLMESRDIVVLDADGEILQEYTNNLTSHGQPTVASQFLVWIQRHLTLRANNQVELQKLTVLGDREYEEFPQSPDLTGFDLSDRKFIALSNAHPEHPPVVEGSDSLWWGFKDVLDALGIHIAFVCEDYVRTKYEETHNA